MAVTLVCTNFGFRFGRRMSILVGDLLVMIGGAIQASSYSVGQIVRTLDIYSKTMEAETDIGEVRSPRHLRIRYRNDIGDSPNLHDRDYHQSQRTWPTSCDSMHVPHLGRRVRILGRPWNDTGHWSSPTGLMEIPYQLNVPFHDDIVRHNAHAAGYAAMVLCQGPH